MAKGLRVRQGEPRAKRSPTRLALPSELRRRRADNKCRQIAPLGGEGDGLVSRTSRWLVGPQQPRDAVCASSTPGVPGYEDGVGGGARFNTPSALAVDDSGNVYVADAYNHSIRKISPGTVVPTIAGSPGAIGAAPGALPASLNFPSASRSLRRAISSLPAPTVCFR